MHFIKNTYPLNLFIRDAYYNYRIEDGKIAKTDGFARAREYFFDRATLSIHVAREKEPNTESSSSSSSARHIHTT